MSTTKPPPTEQLDAHLVYLKLVFLREHYAVLATEAARAHRGHVEYLARLIEGEALLRHERSAWSDLALPQDVPISPPDAVDMTVS